jgi:hypothetical protein
MYNHLRFKIKRLLGTYIAEQERPAQRRGHCVQADDLEGCPASPAHDSPSDRLLSYAKYLLFHKIRETLNYLEEELVSGDLFYELARISSIEFHPKVQGDRGDT